MAQSQAERVTMLERLVDVHANHLDAIKDRVIEINYLHTDMRRDLTDLKREAALLQREVIELRKWQDDVKKGKEEWSRKLWMIVPPVLAVLISTGLTLAITLTLRK